MANVPYIVPSTQEEALVAAHLDWKLDLEKHPASDLSKSIGQRLAFPINLPSESNRNN